MVRPPHHTAVLAAWLTLAHGVPGQFVRDAAVELSATLAEAPAAITLSWPATPYPLTRQELHRRRTGEPTWQPLAAPLPANATTFTDPDVAPGRGYEYRLTRQFSGDPWFAVGYLCAGGEVPLPDDRGRLILLVEQSLASPLAQELATLTTDLHGDGWSVARIDLPAATPPPAVRALVQAAHAADPARTNHLFILGHVAVPYSGRTAPDFHDNHLGAWPTDAYYADTDGHWPDSAVDVAASFREPNHNHPGDGRFDPSFLTKTRAPELAVGRVDFSALPGAPAGEVELTRRYLARNHAWRHALPPYQNLPRRAFIDDQFGFFFGEAFAAGAWRAFPALVGSAHCHEGEWLDDLPANPSLLAYGCGPGNMEQVGGVVTSGDFFATPSQAAIIGLFGSFCGDWDYPDNVLRAALAGPAGSLALASFWAGRPHAPLHLLGRGATLGECLHAAHRNAGDWQTGWLAGSHPRGVHLGLLGDPTLHLFPSPAPAALTATPGPGSVTLAWDPPAATGVVGYLVARAPSPGGPFIRLRQQPVAATTFTDRTVAPGATGHYRVRAVVRTQHPGGTLLVPGQSAFATTQAGPPAPAPDLRVTGNGLPVANGDPATTPSNNTRALGPQPLEFTLANVGGAPLVLAQPPLLDGPGAAHFKLRTAPQGTLAPGETTRLELEFAPAAAGTAEATVELASNDPGQSPFAIVLAGDAAAPAGRFRPLPAVPAFGLPPATTGTRSILLENPGPGTLEVAITNPFDAWRARDSEDPGGPAFTWNDISSTGTPVAFSDPDDAVSAPLPIGFPFPFGGTDRTTVRACTNGYVTFSDHPPSIANPPLPNPAAPPDLIAGFWQDLIVPPDGSVRIATNADGCTIQFSQLAPVVEPARRVTFQLILRRDGTIGLLYQRVDAVPELPVAGVQQGPGTRGLTLPNPPAAGTAVTILPPGSGAWLALTPTTAVIPAGTAVALTLTLDSAAAGPGRHRLDLPVTTSDPLAPAITLPLAIDVAADPSPRAAWRLAAFGAENMSGPAADDAADPDFDAAPNLLEYALGSHPLDPSSRPAFTLTPAGFSFRRNAALDDLDLTVQFAAPALGPWSAAAVSAAGGPIQPLALPVLNDSGPTDLKSVTIQPPPPPAFLRLLVEPR